LIILFQILNGTERPALEAESQELFLELLNENLDKLYSYCWKLTLDQHDAEDLVSETTLKAYEKFGRLREREKFNFWLFKIAGNTFRTKIKRKRRIIVDSLDRTGKNGEEYSLDPVDGEANPHREAERSALTLRVEQALSRLDPDLRQVVVLFNMQGFTLKEIQGMLGLPLGTVKTRLRRARLLLRELLSEDISDFIREGA
jgi:RNA polymerase sigma-70 factor (ECF subfamily)